MALLSGFDRIEASNNTFSDWLNKTNEMIDLFRDNTVTANSSGANTDGNVRINGEFVSNTLIAFDELRGGDLFDGNGGQLNITSNTVFTSNADFVTFESNTTAEANLSVEGTLFVSAANLDYILIPDNYNDLIPNQPSGRLLGNTDNRWEGYFSDIDVSGNLDIDDTLTTGQLVVTNSASLPSTLTFTGDTSFEDITVTGVASFANLEVQSLTTNSAALVGAGDAVVNADPTVIDQFDKTVSRGFKYIIHGENDDSTSAYAIEINCSHNGNDVYFTRFGEVSNNFDAVIVPQINGGNVELLATCSNASSSNTHSFNMVRIETR
jgi:hypothetical protein